MLVCSFNTRGYWPPAYHPRKNSLYIPFHDSCLDMTANTGSELGSGPRVGIPRPGSDPNAFTGLAKLNVSTGRVDRIYSARTPSNGAVLATAGDLIFWGDVDRRFRAFDADSGRILWETIVGGVVQMSTISYSVNGKQYILVMTALGAVGNARSRAAGARNELGAQQRNLRVCVAITGMPSQQRPDPGQSFVPIVVRVLSS